MIVDVHNLTVKEALDLIRLEIKKANKLNISRIEVIHGFNNGASIKKRLLDLKDPLIVGMFTKPTNPGSTIINIRIKLL